MDDEEYRDENDPQADRDEESVEDEYEDEHEHSALEEIEDMLAGEATPLAPWVITVAWVISALFHLFLMVFFAKVVLSEGSDGSEGDYIGVPIEASQEILKQPQDKLKPEEKNAMTLELENIPTANLNIATPALLGKFGAGKITLKAGPPRKQTRLEIQRKRGHIKRLLFPKKALPLQGSRFFGAKARGRKFVYIIDRSSSMRRQTSVRIEGEGTALYRGNYLDIAKREIQRSVRALEPGARFHVIFFADAKETAEMPGGKLQWATETNRRQCADWLKTVGFGAGTEPAGALRAAIKLKPDAIFLLCDGRFSEDVVKEIARFNRASGVPIHTLAFVDRSGEKILQDLAKQNGGVYRYVPPDTHRESKRGRGRSVGDLLK